MKKTLSLMLAMLMLLASAACVRSEDAGLIPGTEFPLPDRLIASKAVSVTIREIPDEFMRMLADADMTVELVYADRETAASAFSEYQSKMAILFPSLADSTGNILRLPDKRPTEPRFSLQVKFHQEVVTVAGADELGWFDYSSCADVLKNSRYTPEEKKLSVSSDDRLSAISIELMYFGDLNPDFEFVKEYLLGRYRLDLSYSNYTREMSEEFYQNVEDTELELDGRPAYRVTYETDDPFQNCYKLTCAGYVTYAPGGGFIRISVSAPKASPESPTRLEDFCRIVENTYTRNKP